jgi:hypothetical protein
MIFGKENFLADLERDIMAGMKYRQLAEWIGLDQDSATVKWASWMEGKTAGGIPNLVAGVAAPGPGSWQLPANWNDFAGAIIKDATVIWSNAGQAFAGPDRLNTIEQAARQLSPSWRVVGEIVDAYRTEDHYTLDKRGFKAFQLEGAWDNIVNLTGFRTEEREFQSTQSQMQFARDTKKKDVLGKVEVMLRRNLNFGRPAQAEEAILKYIETVEKYGPDFTSSGEVLDFVKLRSAITGAMIPNSMKVQMRSLLTAQEESMKAQASFESNR